MKSRPLITLRLHMAATQNLGATPYGERVTFPVVGGEFDGERLRGKVLPGGADWTIRRTDGALDLDLRITLQTDDDAFIHMTFVGLRDDVHGYFRTLVRFETGAIHYEFLNRLLGCGAGQHETSGPVHVIDEIL